MSKLNDDFAEKQLALMKKFSILLSLSNYTFESFHRDDEGYTLFYGRLRLRVCLQTGRFCVVGQEWKQDISELVELLKEYEVPHDKPKLQHNTNL